MGRFRRTLLEAADAYPRGTVDPLENRTTELTASVLGLDGDVARAALVHFASLGGRDAEGLGAGGIGVATQVTTANGQFVDLELEARSAQGVRELLVWVEIKTGAPETGTQIGDYEVQVADIAGDAAIVVVLHPAGDRRFEHVLQATTWSALVRVLERTRRRAWRRQVLLGTSSAADWRLHELITHLERNGIVMPSQIISSMRNASFAQAADANATMLRFFALVHERIASISGGRWSGTGLLGRNDGLLIDGALHTWWYGHVLLGDAAGLPAWARVAFTGDKPALVWELSLGSTDWWSDDPTEEPALACGLLAMRRGRGRTRTDAISELDEVGRHLPRGVFSQGTPGRAATADRHWYASVPLASLIGGDLVDLVDQADLAARRVIERLDEIVAALGMVSSD